jgi:hypothetical protein
MAKIIADGANIRRRSRSDFRQRVEDNAFHLLTAADAVLGVPSGAGWAAEWESAAALKSPWLLRWAWQ